MPASDDERAARLTNNLFDDELLTGYGYLISSSVRVVDLYPLLLELFLGTRCDKTDTPQVGVVATFIDDYPPMMLRLALDDYVDSYVVPSVDQLLTDEPGLSANVPYARWIHTQGTFVDAESTVGPETGESKNVEPDEKSGSGQKVEPADAKDDPDREKFDSDCGWEERTTVGAGNPMTLFRQLRRCIYEQCAHVGANIFAIVSLGGLYNNLGLADTAAFVAAASETVWNSSNPVPEYNRAEIGANDGVLLAVVEEDAMDAEALRRLKTQFDGLIEVKYADFNTRKGGQVNLPTVTVRRLPRHFNLKTVPFGYLLRKDANSFITEGVLEDGEAQPIGSYLSKLELSFGS